jgi:hypothetical protein
MTPLRVVLLLQVVEQVLMEWQVLVVMLQQILAVVAVVAVMLVVNLVH